MMFIPIVYYIVFRYIPMFGNIIAFRRYRAGSSIFGDEWSGLKYFNQMEMLNLWGTPMTDTVNAWTCKFAMNQADINNDWDTYVAEVEAQNMQNIVDMYNDTYNASK